MKTSDISTLLNNVIKPNTEEGGTVLQEDLSNVVDFGYNVIDYVTDDRNKELFLKTLVDGIAEILYHTRGYETKFKQFFRSMSEYGSIVAKTRIKDFAFEKDDKYALPADGESVDPFVINRPEVLQHFWNKSFSARITQTVQTSTMKSAFKSAEGLTAFISQIESTIIQNIDRYIDNLIRASLCALIANCATNSLSIDLAEEYREIDSTFASVTNSNQALHHKEFLKYCSKRMKDISNEMTDYSKNFNAEQFVDRTTKDLQELFMLSPFMTAMENVLYSDTFNAEFVKSMSAQNVNYWQATNGLSNDFEIISKVDVKIVKDVLNTETTFTQNVENVVGLLFDNRAISAIMQNREVRSQYNASGDYTNYFYSFLMRLVIDNACNAVIFTMTFPETTE